MTRYALKILSATNHLKVSMGQTNLITEPRMFKGKIIKEVHNHNRYINFNSI